MNDVIYDDAFFEGQMAGSRRSARHVVPVVLALVEPRSVIDVGCGGGTWLATFREHGIDEIIGLDGDYVARDKLEIPSSRFISCDLNQPIAHEGNYDLVVSLEVAEHLPGSAAEQFVAKLVSFSKVVLFSAAIPGQGGVHHVNEQWPEYWRALFSRHDYVPVDCLRRRIWEDANVLVCYRQNIMFYVECQHLRKLPRLAEEQAKQESHMFSVVHPQLFTHCLARPPSLKPILRAFPGAVFAALKRTLRVNA